MVTTTRRRLGTAHLSPSSRQHRLMTFMIPTPSRRAAAALLSFAATTALLPAIGGSNSRTSTDEIVASSKFIQSLSRSAASPSLAKTRDLLGAFATSQFLREAHFRKHRSALSMRRPEQKSLSSFPSHG